MKEFLDMWQMKRSSTWAPSKAQHDTSTPLTGVGVDVEHVNCWKRLGTGGIYIKDQSWCDKMDFKTIVTISRTIPDKSPGSHEDFEVVAGLAANHMVRRDGNFIVHLKESLNPIEEEFLKTSSLGVRFRIEGEADAQTLTHLLQGLVNAHVAFTENSDLATVVLANYASMENKLNSTFGNGVVVPANEWKSFKTNASNWEIIISTEPVDVLDRVVDENRWSNEHSLGPAKYAMVLKDTYEDTHKHETVYIELLCIPKWKHRITIHETRSQSSNDAKGAMWRRLAERVGTAMLSAPDWVPQVNGSEKITCGLSLQTVELETMDFIAAVMLSLPKWQFNITTDVADKMHEEGARSAMKEFLDMWQMKRSSTWAPSKAQHDTTSTPLMKRSSTGAPPNVQADPGTPLVSVPIAGREGTVVM
eukprot:GHVS01058779.1.p1 GENE.GHVS01058779.1~~GHVS01058779.1.p1  ORF type:complete len:418 (+),score=21.80 GHVS01058779.1:3-1256(+)